MPEDAPLGAELMQAYRHIAAGGEPTTADMRALQAAGLAEPDAASGVALRDPRAVAHSRVGDALGQLATVERALRAVGDALEEAGDLEALHHHYDSGRFYGGQASEFLGTGQAVNDHINDAVEAAEREILAAQPGAPIDRDPAIVALGTGRSVRARRRGVAVHTLYNRLVAEHDQARTAAEEIIEAGGEARVLPPVFPRMVLVDSRHLFIDNLVGPGEPNCAWHVTDRASIAWARSVFRHAWDRATPWSDVRAQSAEPVTERQRQILGLLASGQTQTQISARLNVSRRTVENELAGLREALGMETTFQVMAWWGARREGRA
ncbi:LuxR C-terminal-related transcriptional regulator [Streptomyces sp. NRRL F-5630]|uniref:helix-turn-helix transcriptional regulator n=1 Tax=Streptomyces sp. NRRL F-5630 TaxID=1463864 RepID=UPI003EB92EB1